LAILHVQYHCFLSATLFAAPRAKFSTDRHGDRTRLIRVDVRTVVLGVCQRSAQNGKRRLSRCSYRWIVTELWRVYGEPLHANSSVLCRVYVLQQCCNSSDRNAKYFIRL